ncbi:MAG: glyoxylate/hydroxypyruvate reductase A [Rhodobacteraceae bacterium]|nr:glyoxylate/hydroxypyruvate reductase A [Paracoccaceae bacterium]
MPINVFFAAGAESWPDYQVPLSNAFAEAGLDATLSDSAPDPASVDYLIFSPTRGTFDFSPYRNCKAVLSLWAGVERIVTNPTLTQPLCRMVDRELTEGMVEYVVGHVLRHHLGMDTHIRGQDGVWRHAALPPIARQRRVVILGMGALGSAAGQALAALNFPVTGWSRTQKTIPGITCLWGEDGLRAALGRADILVTLLPSTPETESLLNGARLGLMPRGSVIINPGRGPLIDDDALLAALDSGQIGHATLDVFRIEPLPPEHPYWGHPNVTVTPHIAADTRAGSAAKVVAENIRRSEAGEPLLYLVDRARGY